jgi:hypothetical protein
MILRSLLSQRLIPRSISVTEVTSSSVLSFSRQRWQRGVVSLDDARLGLAVLLIVVIPTAREVVPID